MAETQNTVIEYPVGLSEIPFASFLQIEKYSYDEAQKKVQTSQNDALGSLANSRIADIVCLLYTSPSPRDLSTARMRSSA